MDPEMPQEFKNACRNLGPHLEDLVTSLDDMVQVALIGVDAKDAAVIRRFLDDILDGRYTPDQMKDFWWSTPATTVFYDGRDVVTFLSRMREVLSQPPYTNAPSGI